MTVTTLRWYWKNNNALRSFGFLLTLLSLTRMVLSLIIGGKNIKVKILFYLFQYNAEPLASWKIEDIIIYFGADPKKNAQK